MSPAQDTCMQLGVTWSKDSRQWKVENWGSLAFKKKHDESREGFSAQGRLRTKSSTCSILQGPSLLENFGGEQTLCDVHFIVDVTQM